jgi:hypothetical protein
MAQAVAQAQAQAVAVLALKTQEMSSRLFCMVNYLAHAQPHFATPPMLNHRPTIS